uniref:Uncharacterized protein n=1 Tax=Heliothis virescens TaxID=7102 RepID=A0A2A4J3Q7_HELVI
MTTILLPALTNCVERQPDKKKKSISLSLHTVLDFDDKDKKDVNIVDIVQTFMQNLNTALDANKKKPQTAMRKFREARDTGFTDFLQEAIEILNGYKDEDFDEFFLVLNDELKKYHYRGCKFYELTDNLDTRRLLDAKLGSIKGKPNAVTKANLNALAYLLKEEIYDDNVRDFLDHVNSLYNDDSKEKFQKVLHDLEQYRSKSKRTNIALVKIVRDGIRSVVFDHYTNLDVNTRRELKNKIDKFWSKFKRNNLGSGEKNDDNKTVEIKNKKKTPKSSENKPIASKEDKLRKRDKKNKKTPTSDDSLNVESTIKTVKSEETNQKSSDDHSSSVNSEKLPSNENFQSNSIEFSLERQQEYNTQRYVTLYTESITGTSKKTSKKVKKIKSRIKSQKVKKNYSEKQKLTTKSETETKVRGPQIELRIKTDDLKQKKIDIVRSMADNSNKNILRTDNRKAKSEGIGIKKPIDPMEDTDAGSDIAPDSTELSNTRRSMTTKSVTEGQHTIRLEAVFGDTSKDRTSFNIKGTQKDLRRDNSSPLTSAEGLSIEMFKKDKEGERPLRRTANNNTNLNQAEIIFMKRINDLEKEINEVKHKIEVNVTNDEKETEKGKGKDDIVKLVDGNDDSTKLGKKAQKNDKKATKYTLDDTEAETKNTSAKDSKNNSKKIHTINTTENINDNNKTKKSTMEVKNETSKDNSVATSKNDVSSGRNAKDVERRDGSNNLYGKKIPFINNNDVNKIMFKRYTDFKS